MIRLMVTLFLIISPVASLSQIACAVYNESKEASKSLPDAGIMLGCKSFNELVVAKGIEIKQASTVKSYGCFAVDLPHEADDLFIFVEIGQDIDNPDKTKPNGWGLLTTYHKGLKINGAMAEFEWRQYPKDHSSLWTPGIWLGDGKTQLVSLNADGTLTRNPKSDEALRAAQLPQLEVSVDDDTVRLNLALNNDKHALETLSFNRFTGKAVTNINSGAWRCIQATPALSIEPNKP